MNGVASPPVPQKYEDETRYVCLPFFISRNILCDAMSNILSFSSNKNPFFNTPQTVPTNIFQSNIIFLLFIYTHLEAPLHAPLSARIADICVSQLPETPFPYPPPAAVRVLYIPLPCTYGLPDPTPLSHKSVMGNSLNQ